MRALITGARIFVIGFARERRLHMVSTVSHGPGGSVTVIYRERCIASLKYDVSVTLEPTRANTRRVFVPFEQGVTIVGFSGSVVPLLYDSFPNRQPTLDDVLVDWDLFERNHFTSTERIEETAGVPPQARQVTTLKSLCDENFFPMKALPAMGNSPPQTGFTFYNRYPTSGPGMLPAAISIRLTVHAEPLETK